VLVVVWLLWLRRADRVHYDELRAGPSRSRSVPRSCRAYDRRRSHGAGELLRPRGGDERLQPTVEADSNPLIHALRTVAMFGLAGDQNPRHDVAALPLVPLPLSVVAGFGLVRLWRMRRDPSHSLVLLALPVFLAAPLVATEGGSPHALRALGLAAPLGVVIGLGAVELVEQVRGTLGAKGGDLAVAAVAVTLTAVVGWSGWA